MTASLLLLAAIAEDRDTHTLGFWTEDTRRAAGFIDAQGMTPADEVTRIEWRYLDEPADGAQ